MTLSDPFWLILAIPLAMSLWLWRLPSRVMTGLRCAAMALSLAALCGIGALLPLRSGTVVLVADRSLSMPPGSEARQKEAVDLIQAAAGPDDKLIVESFAETAAIEQPRQTGTFGSFSARVGGEASNLSDALDLALSRIGRKEPGRILIFSDGRWTGRDPAASAARAAAAGIAIDYRAQQRSAAGDLAVERIQGPDSVISGESFMISAWIDSPVGQTIDYELSCGGQPIAEGKQAIASGVTRLLFRDTAAKGGARSYVLRVRGDAPDPVPENNLARLLVGVRGERPILCVSPRGGSALASLLARGGLNIQSLPASQCEWTLERMAGYSAVLLENTSANGLGRVGMENLAAWVSQSGGGLMLTGGRDSFGPGGYYKSPIEPILPLSMELRREHRKLSLAIVVALDRSGSMAMTVPDGRRKMDLANLATAEVIEMLGPADQFGCIAVDSIPHEIVPLSDVTNREGMKQQVLRIDSLGGGIFIYEALVAAARMIQPAVAGTKHIILFADAADSEEPGDYANLVEKCVRAGISISVIGLGTERDCDAPLLKDIARRGGGQCQFTDNAQELPRLFAQDTVTIARSAFIEEPVGVRPTGGLVSISRQPFGEFPQIGGYNLCYARTGTNVAAVSEDEYKAPIVASWQAGLGRVLCYTGEADGQYTGPIAQWSRAGDFFTSLARWTAGRKNELGDGAALTQRLRAGLCTVELHLDPERQTQPFDRLPELTLLTASPGEPAASRKIRMNWITADKLSAEIPLRGGETVLATVEAAGLGQATLPPVCLPYSPEFQPPRPDQGTVALDRLARSTGGIERVNLAGIWKDIPKTPQIFSLTPYLLLTAVALFLLEVVQRRTGIFSVRWKRLWKFRRHPAPAQAESLPATPSPISSPKPPPAEKKKPPHATAFEVKRPTASPKPPAAEPTPQEAISDALGHAQRQARKRTGRN